MTRSAVRVALGYFVLGSLWIVGTDWLLARLTGEALNGGEVVKGLLFVSFGALLLYGFLLRWQRERQATSEDRARLERRLAAVARFEAIGQLTSSIAHDFNNLLTAITGNIEAYRGRLPGGDESDELRAARRAADRATELTRQLLAVGRRQAMRPERVDLNRVVGGMCSLLRPLIGDHVRMRTELADDLAPVHADPGSLEQVLMNLAINARDAMPGGGELRVRTANVRVDAEAAREFPFPFLPGDYVRLEVEDTGQGIEPDLQRRIFEPFFTTKPKEIGTGLGLATVYGIVKQTAGYITVDSEPGVGARFSVYLPRSLERLPVRPEDAPADEPMPEVGGTETLLVVEDDPAVRSLMIRVLRRSGFAVLDAEDGQEALEIVQRGSDQIDMLITDAGLPRLDGPRLIREVRAAAPRVRSLLISGYAQVEVEGDVPYLAKPFTPVELVRRVREVLDGPVTPSPMDARGTPL